MAASLGDTWTFGRQVATSASDSYGTEVDAPLVLTTAIDGAGAPNVRDSRGPPSASPPNLPDHHKEAVHISAGTDITLSHYR